LLFFWREFFLLFNFYLRQTEFFWLPPLFWARLKSRALQGFWLFGIICLSLLAVFVAIVEPAQQFDGRRNGVCHRATFSIVGRSTFLI
jgi:hypothetical protein